MNLRISRFLPKTRVEGPGIRSCIWVQGCPIRCPGCINKEIWAFNGGFSISVKEILEEVLKQDNVEGITFLGGEPFEQAEALSELGRQIRNSGLSVVTFTGYIYESLLQENRSDWNDLLSVTDLLIDGPYMEKLHDTRRPWVGSSNQRYIFLNDRYRHLDADLKNIRNKFEIQIKKDGVVRVNGMGRIDKILNIIEN